MTRSATLVQPPHRTLPLGPSVRPQSQPRTAEPVRPVYAVGAVALTLALTFAVLLWSSDVSTGTVNAAGGVMSLLDRPEWRRTRIQAPFHPVEVARILPLAGPAGEGDPLRALVLPPPCEVSIDLPLSAPGAQLAYAIGVAADSWRGRGEVLFEAEFHGRAVLHEVLAVSDEVPATERAWRHRLLPVGEGGRLVLRTTYRGDSTRPPRAAFAGLEILRPEPQPNP